MDAPLLVVVGPTASGKSRLGLEAAERLGGEIVSADAFAVYRGLDIGTDKPDPASRARVPHHLLDVADPRERFSAGQFLAAADAAVADIRARGRQPVVVGGTHFYVRALLLGLFPSPPHDPELRRRLEHRWQEDPAALRRELERVDPEAAARIQPADRQRILRALEVYEQTGEAMTAQWRAAGQRPRYRALLAAPLRPRSELYARIDARVEMMFASGLVKEVEHILAAGVPRHAHALKAIGYREVVSFLDGASSLEGAVAATRASSRHLAKRQLTWLRRHREGELHWCDATRDSGVERLLELWGDFGRGEER